MTEDTPAGAPIMGDALSGDSVIRDAPSGALPTYLRIAEALTIDIGAGRLSAGEKLPPERTMAAEYRVAVATLRKALGLLEERGLIERRQGSGNYVRAGGKNIGTYALFRLERKGIGGGLPTARLLDLQRTNKPEGLPDIGRQAEDAMRIRRLRFLADVPVAVEEIWLDGRWHDGAGLTPRSVSESLYRTYADKLGLHIREAVDVISAAPLPDWTPPDLGLAPGTPVGFIERRAFDQHGAAAEASWTWFDPARAQYFSRVP